jgi:hypothetical protein
MSRPAPWYDTGVGCLIHSAVPPPGGGDIPPLDEAACPVGLAHRKCVINGRMGGLVDRLLDTQTGGCMMGDKMDAIMCSIPQLPCAYIPPWLIWSHQCIRTKLGVRRDVLKRLLGVWSHACADGPTESQVLGKDAGRMGASPGSAHDWLCVLGKPLALSEPCFSYL